MVFLKRILIILVVMSVLKTLSSRNFHFTTIFSVQLNTLGWAILERFVDLQEAEQTNAAWREHTRIIRGNPVRTYEGERFILKKCQ